MTRSVRVLASIAILAGGVYLAAWLGGRAATWSAAGVITMKTNMAVALLLAGSALALLGDDRAGTIARWLGVVAAIAVASIGMLTLSEHLLGLDLGIDQLIATELPGAAATASPNRMGVPGSVSLVLLGVGLVALAWKRRYAVHLGVATFLIVLVPALGFLYGLDPLFGMARLAGIAWPTVVALSSLAIGLVLAPRSVESNVLWRDDPGGVLLRRVLIPAVLGPLALGYLRIQGERYGLFDTATGTGLFAFTMVVLFAALLWRVAAQLSAAAAAELRAGQALRESQGRLRGAMQQLESMLENSPLAVIEWSSSDFVISRWSDGATRVFGWTATETVGKRIDQLDWVPGDDWLLVRQVMGEMLSGKRPRNVSRNRNIRKDRSIIHCEWYNSTVTDPEGNLTGVLSLVLDVTERVNSEAALREADRRKSDFLGVLSHELRNPLAPIQNSIHLLDLAPPGSDQALRAREVIRRQTAHLTRLVDDLLDLTRISRGKIELQRRRLDLAAVVRRTCDDHRGVFDARGVALRLEAPSLPVWVNGDETRIAQMVGNLLHNAAKFSDRGGAVTVRAVVDGDEAEIRVRDDGMGMGPEIMRNLFQPFAQAEEGLARTRGGLGLGLAFVKTLAVLHGGSVRAASDGPGRGSEFVVRLPLAPAPAERAGPQAARERGRPRDVLVIEDNADAAETLAEVLRLHGHRVRVATGGRSGIELARQHRPDVIFCDIGLPDLDGYGVARELRQIGLSAVRLIALTGYAQSHDKARAEQAGFDAHLAKPPPVEALLGMLGESPPT